VSISVGDRLAIRNLDRSKQVEIKTLLSQALIENTQGEDKQ
jgi:hypothetical protein